MSLTADSEFCAKTSILIVGLNGPNNIYSRYLFMLILLSYVMVGLQCYYKDDHSDANIYIQI